MTFINKFYTVLASTVFHDHSPADTDKKASIGYWFASILLLSCDLSRTTASASTCFFAKNVFSKGLKRAIEKKADGRTDGGIKGWETLQ